MGPVLALRSKECLRRYRNVNNITQLSHLLYCVFLQTCTDVLPVGIIPSLVPFISFLFNLFQVRSIQVINNREYQSFFFCLFVLYFALQRV